MDAMSRLLEADAVRRLVDRDPTLFSDDVDLRQPILQRLGWTDLAEKAEQRLPLITNLAAEAAREGATDVVLLGMGGSSLAPLVISRVMGPVADAPRLHVLDTTAPSAVARVREALTPQTTVFVVSSKSGTTIEPLSLYAIFREWMDAELGRVAAGKRFIVVTDPGTPLEARRQKDVMRVAVAAPPTVGGRFSALSVFGLLPTGLAGIDVSRIVEYGRAMERACHGPAGSNPGAQLAAWLADNLASGRDKLTLVTSGRYRSFGLWVEQLVAESTGKQGVGIVPVLEDGSVTATSYGDDRMLVVVRDEADGAEAAFVQAAREAGVPVTEHLPPEPAAIGAEFVRWEFAVALTGFLMGVNPFDEPNVAEAKAATTGVLEGTTTVPAADADFGGFWTTATGGLAGAGTPGDLRAALATLTGSLAPSGYLAILAYLPDDEELIAPLRTAAAEVATALRAPVCLELGPRYLHSTGQLHKGGPATGSFLLVTARGRTDLPVPGEPFSLAQLFRAQAEGDLVTLASRGRPVLRVDLPDEQAASVGTLGEALADAARG